MNNFILGTEKRKRPFRTNLTFIDSQSLFSGFDDSDDNFEEFPGSEIH
jgi:hypothetical protein